MDILTNVGDDTDDGYVLIDPRNYASDKKVVGRINDEIISVIPQVRNLRRPLQDRWTRFRQCYDGIHNRKLYQGRSDLYWRLVYKVVETFVAHIKSQIFPTQDSFYIEPSPFDQFSQMLLPTVRRLLRHDVEISKMERHLDTFLRTGLIEGVSVVKEIWSVKRIKQIRRVAKKLGEYDNTIEATVGFAPKLTLYEGPTFTPIRNLDFYVHPSTVTDIDDARMVFEDVWVDTRHLEAMARAGKYLNVPELYKRDAGNKIIPQTAGDKDLQRSRELVTEQMIANVDKGTFILQEIWTNFDFKGDGYRVPAKIVACNGVILEARQNPLFAQRPPYLAWHCIDKPGTFWGTGVVEPVEHLNIAANAIGNQMLDAVVMQTNHIIGVNVALLAQDVTTLRVGPRSIWPSLANPDQVFKEFRPPDNTQTAMMSLQMLSGAIQDIAGAPAMMQGKFSNSDKTAHEIQATMQGAMAALAGMVRNVESHVMSPTLYNWWLLEQQFRAVDSTVKITGAMPMKVDPQDLVGDYGFRWLVSTQVPDAIKAIQEQAQAMAAQGGAQPMGPGPMMPGGGPQGGMMPPGPMPNPIGGPSAPPTPGAMGMGTQPHLGL